MPHATHHTGEEIHTGEGIQKLLAAEGEAARIVAEARKVTLTSSVVIV